MWGKSEIVAYLQIRPKFKWIGLLGIILDNDDLPAAIIAGTEEGKEFLRVVKHYAVSDDLATAVDKALLVRGIKSMLDEKCICLN